MARVGPDSPDPFAQAPAHRPPPQSSALRSRAVAPLKPLGARPAPGPPRPRREPAENPPARAGRATRPAAPARSVPRRPANGEQGEGGGRAPRKREASAGDLLPGWGEGPTTALLARCCRVLSPSPDPALLGDEVSRGCGCTDGASVRAGGGLGLRGRGAAGVGAWLACPEGGRALGASPRPSLPGPRSTCGSCPRSATPRPPFPFLFPPLTRWRVGVTGRGGQSPDLGLRGLPPAPAGGVGRGLLTGDPAPAPARAPTPRPLLLGKPAGAAGGRAAQTTASPQRRAVGDSSACNGPGCG